MRQHYDYNTTTITQRRQHYDNNNTAIILRQGGITLKKLLTNLRYIQQMYEIAC